MTDPSPHKKVIFGLDWADLALAAVFIAIMAAIGQLLFAPYGWIPGALIGLLLIYLAWRRRMGRDKPRDNTHTDEQPPLE